ncbi:MAG: ABC transporter permease [Candidatus Sumerlaeaceae bacterium]
MPDVRGVFRSLGQLFWPMLALVVLLGYNAIVSPGFFHLEMQENGRLYGSMIDVLQRAAPVLLLALGMTLVIATGGVDLSVGAVMAIAGTVAAYLVSTGHSFWIALVAAVVVSLLCGLINGLLVAGLNIQPIVATLILMVAGRGVAQLISDGQMIPFTNPLLLFVGGGFLAGIPFAVLLALGAYLVTHLFVRSTALGLFIESVGGNPTASRFAGLPAGLVKCLAYVFSGLCAGAAGLIATSDIHAADPGKSGLYLELDAILAVVIGGTALTGGRFSLAGSLLGAILMQALTTTIITRGVQVEYALIIKALVILAVCLLQSPRIRTSGLLRRSTPKPTLHASGASE